MAGSMANNSGKAYENAKVKLIAGDVKKASAYSIPAYADSMMAESKAISSG